MRSELNDAIEEFGNKLEALLEDLDRREELTVEEYLSVLKHLKLEIILAIEA